MKKMKKILIAIGSLLAITISTANIFNEPINISMASSEEEESPSDNLLTATETSNEGDYHRRPTEEQLNIMLNSGEYFNIHYELIELYLLKNRYELERFVDRTHWRFENVVNDGMNNKSCGKVNEDYDSIIITALVEAAIVANNKGIKYEVSNYAREIPCTKDILMLRYELFCLPAFMIGVYYAIKKTQESVECPEELKDFEVYPVNFFEAKQPQEPTTANVPYYWIIVAGVGGIMASTIVFLAIELKKKKNGQKA